MPSKRKIKDVIDRQKPVSFSYGGKSGRRVEVYLLGENRETGIEQIRAYQLNSEQTISGKKGWKIFNLEDISRLTELEDTRKFKIRSEFTEDDEHIEKEYSVKK